jgi:hypothetical protein
MIKQLELQIELQAVPGRKRNPMVIIHGPGPGGALCRDCAHLKGYACARTYWKCSKRGDLTGSRATDQRRTWPACGLFEPEAQP